MNEKGFVNIIVIIGVVVLAAITGYFILNKQPPLPTPISFPTPSPTPTPIPTPNSTSTPTPPPLFDQRQSFETITKGGYSGHDDRKDYVIKEVSEWRNLWDIITARGMPKPVLPSINFNDEMIIAVFQGSHPTGGYSIEITKIIEKDNFLEVIVKETSPSPGSSLTQAFTQPYHIIKIKRVDKEVVFRR